MLNFENPVSFQTLADQPSVALIDAVKASCARGKMMHPSTLKAVVFRLTGISRELGLKQGERDEAAEMASLLANAALQTYGRNSEYGMDLIAGIQAIADRNVA